jgi:hypothetical protein
MVGIDGVGSTTQLNFSTGITIMTIETYTKTDSKSTLIIKSKSWQDEIGDVSVKVFASEVSKIGQVRVVEGMPKDDSVLKLPFLSQYSCLRYPETSTIYQVKVNSVFLNCDVFVSTFTNWDDAVEEFDFRVKQAVLRESKEKDRPPAFKFALKESSSRPVIEGKPRVWSIN